MSSVHLGDFHSGQIRRHGLARRSLAKTDRNDAKTISSFIRFRPDVGRELPSATLRELRAHVAIRARIVEAGKMPGTRARHERGRIRRACSTTWRASGRICIGAGSPGSRSEYGGMSDPTRCPQNGDRPDRHAGAGFASAAAPIAEMPEPGPIADLKVVALAGLAPCARTRKKKEGQAPHRRWQGLLADGSCQAAIAAI